MASTAFLAAVYKRYCFSRSLLVYMSLPFGSSFPHSHFDEKPFSELSSGHQAHPCTLLQLRMFMQEESQLEQWGSWAPVHPQGYAWFGARRWGEEDGVSHRLLFQGCYTWSIATLLLLRWSQTRQRTSLLPDGAVPGPDPVSGTQSTGSISGSAYCMAFWNWRRGLGCRWPMLNLSDKDEEGVFRRSLSPHCEKEQHLKPFRECLKCSGQGPRPGHQVKWWRVRVPRMLLHVDTVTEFLKRRAIQVAVWLKETHWGICLLGTLDLNLRINYFC